MSGLAVAALCLLPLLVVTVPPMIDLPQQLAQIQLLGAALDGDPAYRVQWWHPNKLGYLLLGVAQGLAGLVGDRLAAGRLAGGLLVLSWVAAFHWLAARRGRPPEAAALASLLAFNHCTYWGLVTFQTGVPVFIAWLLLLDHVSAFARHPGAQPFARDAALTAAGTLALYAAHIFWLLAGLAWLAADSLLRRRGVGDWRRLLAPRMVGVLPSLVLTALWYPTLERSGFTSETRVGYSLLERFDPELLAACTFGGLFGSLEPVVAGLLALWLALGLVAALQRRRTQRARAAEPAAEQAANEPEASDSETRVDLHLLAAAGLLAVPYISLPAVAQNTIFLASRWLAPAVALALLAVPRLPARPLLARLTAALVVVSFTVSTANAWLAFNEDDLDGFATSLEAVGDVVGEEPGPLAAAPRLLGLTLIRRSEIVRDLPYYHLHAYAQVVHGTRLANSFAAEASSLVVFRQLPHTPPWTPMLDKSPQRLRVSDLDHFDLALIQAPPETHETLFGRDPRLEPLTPLARWRLYRVAAPDAP